MTRALVVGVSLAVLTAAHFLTPHGETALHDLLFKVTFVPLILAGLWFRPRVALCFSAATSLVYLGHVWEMRHMGHAGLSSLWVGDVVLYNVVAGVTAVLSTRRAEALARVQAQAHQLEEQARVLLRAEETIRTTERLRSLGELASGMAHEIRNPLGGIRGAAEVLVKEETPPEARREFGALLDAEVARLDRVVGNFLDFARPPKPEATALALRGVVDAVFLLVAGEARRREVTLGDEVAADVLVRGDADLLRQVLLNVVLNALQSQERGGAVRVTAEAVAASSAATSDDRPAVAIDVADRGAGVPEAIRRSLFDPYVTGREGGTGMGLAVASRLVESMGGTIALAATGPGGTTFRITLPGG